MATDWDKVKLTLSPETAPLGYGEGALKSFAWSFPELLGVQAPEKVEEWRGENPGTALATELAGFAIPYAGWAKAAGNIPRLAKAMEAVGSAEKLAATPFRAGFAKEVVRFAPLEIGRIAAGQAVGPALADALDTTTSSFGSQLAEGALNLGISGLFGGAGGVLKAYGKAAKEGENFLPGLDLNAPATMQLRAVDDAIQAGALAEPDLQVLAGKLNNLKQAVRAERPTDGRYVAGLDSGDSHAVGRLFNPKSGEGLSRKMLIRGGSGFESLDHVNELVATSGLPEGWEKLVQFPRFVAGHNPKMVSTVDNALTKNLRSLDDGWYWGRERGDGLFVMAKKVGENVDTGRKAGWLLFKTDKPGAFVPDREAWAKANVARSAWMTAERDLAEPVGAEIFDKVVGTKNSLPIEDYRGLSQHRGNVAKVAEFFRKKLAPEGAVDQQGELAKRALGMAKEYVSPAMFQFTKSPLASRIVWAARQAHTDAEGLARGAFYGKAQIAKEGNLYRGLLQGAEASSDVNISGLIDELYKDKDAVHRFWRAIGEEMSPTEAVEKLGVGQTEVRLMKELQRVDSWRQTQTHLTQAAFDEPLALSRDNHYMISHTWKGDLRAPLYSADGQLVGVAGGSTKVEVEKAAAELQKRLGAARIGKVETSDFRTDEALKQKISMARKDSDLLAQTRQSLEPAVAAPQRLRHVRTGMAGYIGETEPWAKQELKDIIFNNLSREQHYLADLSSRRVYADELLALRREDPNLFRQVMQRLDDLSGTPGVASKWQNQITDKVLAPYLGKNTATKVVGAANRLNSVLSFGFWNIGYNIANLTNFVQTSIPHVAMALRADNPTMARHYSWWALDTQKVVSEVGMLDPLKIAGRAFKEMGTPDEALRANMQRAAREAVVDPQFAEESVGQKAKSVVRLKEMLAGEEPFTSWLTDAAMFLPTQTEKLARGHSFTMGHVLGRDIFGFEGEQLYRFAKEFTEKTQFMYSTADRARVITGPLGSAFGLFKNWQMHYIGWLLDYTGQGVMQGNWAPLLWSLGGTVAAGGVGALPLYGVADGVSRWLSGKSAMQQLYSAFGGEDSTMLADAVFYGLPAFGGFSIQNMVAAPFADPGRDATMLFNFAHVYRGQAIGRAVGAAFDQITTTGGHPADSKSVRDTLFQGLMPKAIYRTTQAMEGQLRSMSTGYPMVKGMGLPEQLLYSMGLNPIRIEQNFRVSQELWANQDSMKSAVQAYGKAWAEAKGNGDYGTMRRVMTQAVGQGVDLSAVIRSARSREMAMQQELLSRQFKPAEVGAYRRLGLAKESAGD